ncbi:MAG: helix-turn-helix transcriptional regulator [Prolixibacteraceae bacterium]|jgi:DNA-binding CsgD family transcriptional regulator|nr:helix-turn-helix transcriptional regulator [Prolixibacteraceae bacterium]
MHSGNCIIIHPWSLVQIGLTNILQSLKVDVGAVYSFSPENEIIQTWNDLIVLIDTTKIEMIRKHCKSFKRRNIALIGIHVDDSPVPDDPLLDEILYPSDTQGMIFNKLRPFSNFGKNKQPSLHLSDRETAVLKLVATGFSNKQISEKLFISIHTVISHRKHITVKLGVKSISGLTLYAVLNDLIE